MVLIGWILTKLFMNYFASYLLHVKFSYLPYYKNKMAGTAPKNGPNWKYLFACIFLLIVSTEVFIKLTSWEWNSICNIFRPIEYYMILYDPIEYYRILLDPMVSYRILWDLIDSYRILYHIIGSYRILYELIGSYMYLYDLIGSNTSL